GRDRDRGERVKRFGAVSLPDAGAVLSPSRSAARRGIRRCSITASTTFRRSSSRMLMVINSKLAHDALRQFKPPAACAETLELRHFNFAQMRHDNFCSCA
ncbi:hypothetical protein, partial [Burkholderia pseudomallei]|uniref:hypothetical protein n=1 Tax=Burkholderia pseudomallei TaxID=28450 RepID=UPI0019D6E12B